MLVAIWIFPIANAAFAESFSLVKSSKCNSEEEMLTQSTPDRQEAACGSFDEELFDGFRSPISATNILRKSKIFVRVNTAA